MGRPIHLLVGIVWLLFHHHFHCLRFTEALFHDMGNAPGLVIGGLTIPCRESGVIAGGCGLQFQVFKAWLWLDGRWFFGSPTSQFRRDVGD